MIGRRTAVALLAVATATTAVAGCRTDTVTLGFEPEEGDNYRYRYELDLHLEQALDGGEPEVTDLEAVVTAEVEVLGDSDAGPRARLTIRRDGGADQTLVVVLDRAGSLRAVQEIAGLPVETFGLEGLTDVLSLAAAPPPDGPVAIGDRWTFGEDAPVPRPVTGTARLDRLGVVDGEKVAEVGSSLEQVLDDDVAAGSTSARLSGVLRSDATTVYDLDDGAVRRSRARSTAEVDALIQPPSGSAAAPVPATIRYELEITTTQLG